MQPVIHAFTQANLDNSLGRMKTKEIIAAVNNLKVVFKGICNRCQSLPDTTRSLVDELAKICDSHFQKILASADTDKSESAAIIDELRQAFQAVCLTCSKVSNDDNPSNHGQTFVSLDSGNCQTNSGRAKSTHTDDNVVLSRADWIGMHRAPDIEEHTFGTAPDIALMIKEDSAEFNGQNEHSSTLLPPEVEDRLRMEFSNFVALDIIDKLLLSCILSGMNIAEFAKMLWLPYSIVDPKTRMVKSITKQAAHARWINICKRFPVFMAVAASSCRDSRRMKDRLRKFILNPNGEEPANRFQNGKMIPAFAKASKKMHDQYGNANNDKIARLETEAIDLRKTNNALRASLAKAEGKLKELHERTKSKRKKTLTNATITLPGF